MDWTPTTYELAWAWDVAKARHTPSLVTADLYGAATMTPAERVGNDVLGALGELAVARALGLVWLASVGLPGCPVPKTWPDVYPDVQVRATGDPRYRLIFRSRDVVGHRYVLALCHAYPAVHLAGWVWGREIPDRGVPAPWGDGAWCVSQDRLRPMSEWA